MNSTQSLLHEVLLLVAMSACSCLSLSYDLSQVPQPISAKPAKPDEGEIEPFAIEARNVLWLDGLIPHEPPDVAALLTERARGADRIAGFRVRQETNFHQWLLTHLSLSLVRMKTVIIEGELVRARKQ